ncbi:MAG TPA: uroporphyrinogen-III synthase [Bryobacteraceae bacterium]|nr:uroporphyrinogen-III synthase [Bryobacteraceae bacterium]
MSSLAGQRVVVTRAAHQAEELARPLRALGAEVILLPVIGIAPPADPRPLKEAVRGLNHYGWIIFSSVNAVIAVANELGTGAKPPRGRIAVVGSATRQAVEKLGWRVDVVPPKFVAEELAAAIPEGSLRDEHVLIPSAAVTRDVLARELANKGAIVDVVEAYRNVMPEEARGQAEQVFETSPKPDWVVFTSSSAVDNLVALVGASDLAGVKIASIGPITSASVEAHGLKVSVQPEEHTVAGLVEGMMR